MMVSLYIGQWSFHPDGILKPRFGFEAVNNFCVCNPHHHHVYWRLNFDIKDTKNNELEEFNDPPILGSSNWHVIRHESKKPKNPANNREWGTKKTAVGQSYTIIHGPDDGIADNFGRRDIWFLTNHPNQFDAAVVATGPHYEALIDGFVIHEMIENKDIVVWYGARFTHLPTFDSDATGHIVGLEFVPLN